MKDALTHRCLTQRQLGRFLSKAGSPRFNRVVIEHAEACDTCWDKLARHLPKRERDESEGPLMDRLFPDERPKTRGDCINGSRPCPWVGCRHHLWNDEHHGVPTRVLSLPVIGAPSCVLDVVDEGRELNPTEIGRMIQRRPEEVSAVLEQVLERIRDEGPFDEGDAGGGESQSMWEAIMEGSEQ